MNKSLAIIAVLLFLMGAAAIWYFMGGDTDSRRPGAAPAASGSIPDIKPEEARRRIQAGEKAVLVDVRTPEEYAQVNIPGSLFVPIQPPNTFVERLRRVVPDKDTAIFAFCRSGQRSLSAAEYLAAVGYTKVYNMGGIVDWPYEKNEAVKTSPPPRQ